MTHYATPFVQVLRSFLASSRMRITSSFPAASIEVFTARNVLGYLTEPEGRRSATKCMYRIVAPGGHAIIAQSNALFDLFISMPTPSISPGASSTSSHRHCSNGPQSQDGSGSGTHWRTATSWSGLASEQKRDFMNFHRQPPSDLRRRSR
jgi:hypothetical protein